MNRHEGAGSATGDSSDAAWVAVASFAYSFALAMAGVSIPLVAISRGHEGWVIGVVIAVGAGVQLIARAPLPFLMRRIPDRSLILGAVVVLAGSSALVLVSTSVQSLLVAVGLQGLSRAVFWTLVQTHVVRGEGDTAARLALVNIASGVGQLLGPVVAGLIALNSHGAALAVASAAASSALVPCALFAKMAPFARRSVAAGVAAPRAAIPGAAAAGWMNAAAGAQRALITSWVPIVLVGAGLSSAMVGLLIAAANFGTLGGSFVAPRLRRWRVRSVGVVGTMGVGAGILTIGCFPDVPSLLALTLLTSGVSAGILQTLGPAFAAESVGHERRGDAIVASGTYRAVAMIVAPLAVSLLAPLASASVAIIGLGASIAVSGLFIRSPRRS